MPGGGAPGEGLPSPAHGDGGLSGLAPRRGANGVC